MFTWVYPASQPLLHNFTGKFLEEIDRELVFGNVIGTGI